jgi:murein DD-endopeptidase MepM/ murein hydrolase activator NlpD
MGYEGAQGASAPSYGASAFGSAGTYEAPRSYGTAGVQRSTLDVPPPSTTAYSGQSQSGSRTVAPAAAAPYAATPATAAAERGEAIEVAPGDTLYRLARRHNVSVSELMALNDLKSPGLKPGQKLYLPASRAVRRPLSRSERHEAVAAVEAPPDWTGSYTVKSGDSLYALARQHNIRLADLERYNGIADVRRVKPGTVLKMPASAAVAAAEPAPAPSAPTSTAAAGEAPAEAKILNGAPSTAERVAGLEPSGTASDAPAIAPGAASVAGSTKLRWPVTGRIVSGFGPRTDGTHNDGVNLATPMGTDVHAAESGVVAYAGDELKGYGNLVLLRHDNGWVTAYAHADELLVKRGDRVKRGQVIAKAGRTGQVDQPQVHFELRQGQKPVDPTPFMEPM